MFHVQIRHKREVARAFNLSEQEVRAQFLNRLRAGQQFEFAGKQWHPAETRVIVLEGRELRPDELMLGRGWSSAQRVATDVTERLLGDAGEVAGRPPVDASAPPLTRLKDRIAGRLSAGPLEVREVVTMAGDLMQAALVSDRVALAERAVWEMLHQHAAGLTIDGVLMSEDGWREVLVASGTWTGRDLPVHLVGPADQASGK